MACILLTESFSRWCRARPRSWLRPAFNLLRANFENSGAGDFRLHWQRKKSPVISFFWKPPFERGDVPGALLISNDVQGFWLSLKRPLSTLRYEHIRSEKRSVGPPGKQHGALFQEALFFLSDSCRLSSMWALGLRDLMLKDAEGLLWLH